MHREDLLVLDRYNRWATQRLLAATQSVSQQGYVRHLGDSFGGLRATLVHLYGAEWIWLRRWKGNSPDSLPSPESLPRLSDLQHAWQELWLELTSFLESLDERRLQSLHTYRMSDGTVHSQPLYQQIQHLFNHSTYHRGQVVTLLRQVGIQPPSTDLIRFYRESPGAERSAED